MRPDSERGNDRAFETTSSGTHSEGDAHANLRIASNSGEKEMQPKGKINRAISPSGGYTKSKILKNPVRKGKVQLKMSEEDRKPCRHWQLGSLKLKSFTGTEWEASVWKSHSRATDAHSAPNDSSNDGNNASGDDVYEGCGDTEREKIGGSLPLDPHPGGETSGPRNATKPRLIGKEKNGNRTASEKTRHRSTNDTFDRLAATKAESLNSTQDDLDEETMETDKSTPEIKRSWVKPKDGYRARRQESSLYF